MESAKLRVHRSLRSSHNPRRGNGGSTSPAPGLTKSHSTTHLAEAATLMLATEPTASETCDKKRIPKSFEFKKEAILKALAVPDGDYSDRSPKGSVDEGVKSVLEVVNAAEGWVSTSSCAGRVSVFVEGRKGAEAEAEIKELGDGDVELQLDGVRVSGKDDLRDETTTSELKGGPGGKGGGKWLYVSHEAVPVSESSDGNDSYFTRLFGLEPLCSPTPGFGTPMGKSTRLVHLSFSPLILHILCATLHHARPLLSAAINSGFRESGVQSLKALEDPEAGAMIGVRTAGLSFETVVGVVVEDENGNERFQSIVSEEYLKMCVSVANERFVWNSKRRERLIEEITTAVDALTEGDEEGKAERRERKRAEGLKRQQELRDDLNEKEEQQKDILPDGLEPLQISITPP